MSFWVCHGCDCLQMKSFAQMRRPDVSILKSHQHTGTSWTRPVWRGAGLMETILKMSNHPNMAPNLIGFCGWCHVSLYHSYCTFTFHRCQFCQRKFAVCSLWLQSFKIILNLWDVWLEISVVSAHVNLNGLSVRMKNWKMENRSIGLDWFCLIWFFTSHQQSFSYIETGLPGLNQY